MIIKFNFNYSKITSDQKDIKGTLKITRSKELVNPVYDVILCDDEIDVDKATLFDYALEQYVELRIFELFSNSRSQEELLTKKDYKEIISQEAPVHMIERVLDNMTSVLCEVRQAS